MVNWYENVGFFSLLLYVKIEEDSQRSMWTEFSYFKKG